uniref:Uncharacterized protein n=1 Tax=Cannabis sativa TaxID=3483 RepID=A0A803NJR1_CANSA
MVLTRTKSNFHFTDPIKGNFDPNAKMGDAKYPTDATSCHKKDQTNKDSIPEDRIKEGNELKETDYAHPNDNNQDMHVDDDVEKEGDPDESDPVVTMARKLKETEDKLSLQEQFSLLMHEKMERMEAVIKALTTANKANHIAPSNNTTGKVDPKNPGTYDTHNEKRKGKVGKTSKKVAHAEQQKKSKSANQPQMKKK